MAEIITRKCACCKGEIEIDKKNISNILHFQDKYYHLNCFEIMAAEKATSKRGKPQMWQDALDRVWEIEAETRKMLEHFIAKDELNVWLLENYNITMIPTRFWQVIADLEMGKYKGKRCKPVNVNTLCGCWQWGQKKLNEINKYNRSHNKGPMDDSARLMYDLTVLIGKIPNYLAYKEKHKAAEIERRRHIKENIKIDYSKVANNKTEGSNLQDISDLVDDIF